MINKKIKCCIADASNTINYALQIIINKGYKVFLYPDEHEELLEDDYWGIKDARVFIAKDPLRLLGLINIWENFGDDWYVTKNLYQGLSNSIHEVALPNSIDVFEKMNDPEFGNLVKDYQLFFKTASINIPLTKNTSRQEFFKIVRTFYLQNKEE